MTRIALGIEYDGAQHFGWQRQQEVPSVQGYLEKALSTVANTTIEVQCAGRTDAGVHAAGDGRQLAPRLPYGSRGHYAFCISPPVQYVCPQRLWGIVGCPMQLKRY